MVYGIGGVCVIEDIRKEKIAGERQEYYILKPVYGNMTSTYFVPTSIGDEKIRPVTLKEDIDGLIRSVKNTPPLDLPDEKSRSKTLSDIFKTGKSVEIIRIVEFLLKAKEEKEKLGKKLKASEEKILDDAKLFIDREFACVLETTEERASAYITKKINS